MSASFGSCESRQTYDFALAPDRSSYRQSTGLLPPKTAPHGGGESRGLRGFAVFGCLAGSSGTAERPRFSFGWILLPRHFECVCRSPVCILTPVIFHLSFCLF